MPHNIDLILTLTGGLAAALVLGYVTERLKMSPIVGYLLAGIVVGPFTPGFVANNAIAAQFAELGVILLMFGVGLHFDLDDLFAVRKVAIPGAIVQSAVATVLGVVATWAFGWTLQAGLVFGVAISVASTVVLLRVLADNNELHTHAGHVAVGWLIVEDILTVIALVILPLVVGAEAGESASRGGGILWSLGKALLEIAFLCVFTLVAGRRLLPRLLAHMAKSQSRELFTLCVLVIALGIAVGAAKLFGASMALGAFLAGMVVGQSDFSARAAAEALPLRDAFAVLFFVAMGMLFDPMQMLEHLPLTLATLAVIMIGKPLAALAVTRMLHQPGRTSIAVSVALAQVGEFSFMVASLGLSLGVLPPEATQALVAASIISITLNPALYKLVDPISKRLARSAPVSEVLAPAEEGHIIVVGFGAVGQQIVSLLVEYNLTPTVVDLNADTVHRLRSEGIRAIYGDASMREILEAADIHHARALIFSSNAPTFETVRTAIDLNEHIAVLTRTAYMRDAEALRRVGASVIVSEVEVALAMTENILMRLGATAEQLDRARERVRGEIAGPSEQGAIRELRSLHGPA